MPKKKVSRVEMIEQADWSPKSDVGESSFNLRSTLDKIKTKDGVIGYIIRAATSATVDIKDPSKIIDYAVLSTSVLETAEGLSEAFGLGKLNNVVVKGNNLKVLLVTVGEQRISIFMEKDVDHKSVCKEFPI